MICSFEHETVRVTTTVARLRHQTTLQDVLCASDIMVKLISASSLSKNGFYLNIDDSEGNPRKRKADLFNNPSYQVKIVGLETSDRLFEAVLWVRNREQARSQQRVPTAFGTNDWAITAVTCCERPLLTCGSSARKKWSRWATARRARSASR